MWKNLPFLWLCLQELHNFFWNVLKNWTFQHRHFMENPFLILNLYLYHIITNIIDRNNWPIYFWQTFLRRTYLKNKNNWIFIMNDFLFVDWINDAKNVFAQVSVWFENHMNMTSLTLSLNWTNGCIRKSPAYSITQDTRKMACIPISPGMALKLFEKRSESIESFASFM